MFKLRDSGDVYHSLLKPKYVADMNAFITCNT